MAVSITITETMTELWDADTIGTWVGITFDTFAGFQREGTNCLGVVVSNSTVQGYQTVSSFNALNRKIYIWMSPRGQMDTIENGGVRIVVGDGTNRMAYHVGGSNYYPAFNVGGWTCYMLDANNLPTYKSTLAGSEGSMVWGSITQVGVGFKTLAKSLGGTENCFIDIARHGTGLNIKGGTSGDPGIWAEIAADDASTSAGKAYGIVMEYQPGVYGVQGDITFGDNSGTTTTYFKDQNATVVFLDSGALTYNISAVGNSTGTNTFIDGVVVGSGDTINGRSGSTYLSAGPELYVDFTDSNLDVLELYNTKFQLVDQGIDFGSDTSHILAGVVFQACGQIDIGAVVARNITFSETTSTLGALLWSSSTNIKNSKFIANTTGAGVQHPSATGSPFAYYNLTFSGNTYAVNNTSGSAIGIYKNDGSDPSTYTGSTVTFLGASVTTKIIVKDILSGDEVIGARVLLWVTDDTNFPYQDLVTIVGSGTTATVTHTDHGLSSGDNIIILGANEEAYNGAYEITYISDNSYSYTMVESASSPATGTILATFAFINGITDSIGEIEDVRIVGIDQPVIGRVRRATSGILYQQSPIVGTVDSVTGLNQIIQMIPDE